MRDQTPHLTYAAGALVRPKALLYWAFLFYFLSFVNGLSLDWRGGAVPALAALLLWLDRGGPAAFE